MTPSGGAAAGCVDGQADRQAHGVEHRRRPTRPRTRAIARGASPAAPSATTAPVTAGHARCGDQLIRNGGSGVPRTVPRSVSHRPAATVTAVAASSAAGSDRRARWRRSAECASRVLLTGGAAVRARAPWGLVTALDPDEVHQPRADEQTRTDQQPVPGGAGQCVAGVIAVVGARVAEDDRGVHEQQDARDRRRDPDVVDPAPGRFRAGRAAIRAPLGAALEPAVRQRVDRQQHEVVQQRGADEPGEPVDRVPAAEDLIDRPSGHEEHQQVAHQMQRVRAVEAPEARHHASRNRIEASHLVQCTPGSAGMMIRAGKPWSSDRSTPLTHSASSARSSRT